MKDHLLPKNLCAVNFNIGLKDVPLMRYAGVYKLTFSNGCFYIGSTKEFKMRVTCYKTYFNNPSKMHSKKMLECVQKSSSVRFEILLIVHEPDLLKIEEDKYLKSYRGNPGLINRSPSAFSNKGIQWTKEENTLKSNNQKCRGGRPKGVPMSKETIEKRRRTRQENLQKIEIAQITEIWVRKLGR